SYKASVAHVRAADQVADTDNVSRSGDVGASTGTQRDIAPANGVGTERVETDGCVEGASGVDGERTGADGRVAVAQKWPACVTEQRLETHSRVAAAARVVIERSIAVGRVLVSTGVPRERLRTGRGVVVASCVAHERPATNSRIVAAACIAIERSPTERRIVEARRDIKQRLISLGRVAVRWRSTACLCS